MDMLRQLRRSRSNLADTQHRKLEQYLNRHYQQEVCENGSLLLTLVLSGDKPAALIQLSSWQFPENKTHPKKPFFEFLDLLNLSARQIRGTSGWFVAPTLSGRLDLLPSSELHGRSNRAWHRRLGIILGYPDDVIEYFIESHSVADWTEPEDLVAEGVFTPEELAYTRFVFYIHKDSIRGYERAIKTGRETRTLLGELARRWDLPVLDSIVEKHYHETLDALSE